MFRRLHVIGRGPVALATGLLLTAVVPSAIAAWSIPATGQGSAVASPDFHAPSVTASTVAPVGMTAVGGSVKAGSQYIVYAQVTDPGTGVASVHTNISSLTAGAASVALTPCVASCTIGAKTYAYSSAPVTADAALGQGTKSYSVWAADNIGNTSSPISYSATVDNTAPTVTAAAIAASPSNGAGWLHQGGNYIVYANAADTGGAVATVTANVNSVTPGTTSLSLPKCTTSCTAGGVTYGFKSAVTVATTPLAAGNANFSVTVTDAAASTATGVYQATVDNTAPSQSVAVVAVSTTSAAGFVKSAGSYVVYANATDAGSGISSVVTDVSGLTSGQTALAMPACISSCTVGGVTYGYKSASKTVGALPEGQIAYTVTATDLASNTTTGHYSATVDNTAAAVTGSAIANTTTSAKLIRKSGAYMVYANATDAASGVSTVKANVSTITSGQTALALSACATGCTIGGVTYGYKSVSKNAASTLAAGPVSYSVTATDGVGNASTATGSVTADNAAPTVSAAAAATVATNAPGFIKQGASYIVYGDAADASGIYTLTAKVSTLTTGQTALAMPVCATACSPGGVNHGYASAALAANASLSAGSKNYTLTATDMAGNTTTTSNYAVTVDNTAPTVAITFPLSTYTSGWTAGCGTASTDDLCGTATDATAGVFSVQYSLRQSAAPNLYWNPATSSFSSAGEVLIPATMTLPNWSALAAASMFTNTTGYTIRAVSTDKASNTATTSTSFTFNP
ncbi:MAG TPA: Ig-like domain-containing protein [Mycobacterium sp.]|jgi:hypothetical protein|nr:Ig-like domain-containing protein [Mycobacterium sp.]